jgi:hypothetical protein
MVLGIVISVLAYMNWIDIFGDMWTQFFIGDFIFFAGLIFRGYYRFKKYGKWFQ